MAGTDTSTAVSPSRSAFIDHLGSRFEQACRHTGCFERHFQMAGHQVVLAFAGDALISSFTPAFAHLASTPAPSADLRICIWDRTSTGVVPEAPDWISGRLYGNSEIRDSGSAEPAGIRAAFDGWLGMLSVFDTGTNRAYCWLRDSRHVPITIVGTPLRVILQWWAELANRTLIHAAAVGDGDRAVVIAGASGTGKSSTALSAALAGLRYLGDDFVLIEADPAPAVQSLYNSAKVSPRALETRFSDLRPMVHRRERLDEEKEIIFVHDHWPGRIARRLPLHALLLPVVTGRDASRLVPASPSEVLRALVPGLLPFPAMRQEAISRLGRLTRAVHGLRLELGTSRSGVAAAVEQALS